LLACGVELSDEISQNLGAHGFEPYAPAEFRYNGHPVTMDNPPGITKGEGAELNIGHGLGGGVFHGLHVVALRGGVKMSNCGFDVGASLL